MGACRVARRSDQHLAGSLERNIRALLERRSSKEKRNPRSVRVADAITRFTGSMTFVVLHLILFASWISVNLGWTPSLAFDPTFVVLAMFASVEAIFLSTFVLISQNRMSALNEKRAELDLHVSLLSEHEVTRLIRMTAAIARKLEVAEADDPELPELQRDVHPEHVLERMEQVHRDHKARESEGRSDRSSKGPSVT